MKVLLGTKVPLKKIKAFIEKGNEYPLHYTTGYMHLSNYDIECKTITAYKDKKWLIKLSKLLPIGDLNFQLQIIKQSRDCDLIITHIDQVNLMLAVFRKFRILKTPVLAIIHHSFNPNIMDTKWIWKMYVRVAGYIVFNGFDKNTFMNKVGYENAVSYYKDYKNLDYLEWGADSDFFNITENTGTDLNFVAIGSSNRDYNLLIEVFSELKLPLKIYANNNIEEHLTVHIPSNVTIDKTLLNSNLKGDEIFEKQKIIREIYNSATAILIPIKQQGDIGAGGTVFFETLSSGKPLIVTDNLLFSFDVEKENVGLKVPFGDKAAWIKAVKFIANNPNEAKKMGINARQLSEKRFNYKIYLNSIVEGIKQFEKNKA